MMLLLFGSDLASVPNLHLPFRTHLVLSRTWGASSSDESSKDALSALALSLLIVLFSCALFDVCSVVWCSSHRIIWKMSCSCSHSCFVTLSIHNNNSLQECCHWIIYLWPHCKSMTAVISVDGYGGWHLDDHNSARSAHVSKAWVAVCQAICDHTRLHKSTSWRHSLKTI